MEGDCVFCRIVTGKLEASRVFEDDEVLAFMDHQPVRPGQTLVIPKNHIDHFSNLPIDLATKVFQRAHRISSIMREKLHPQRVGLVVHGYGVPHAHMILVPQEDRNDITSARIAKVENGKVAFSRKDIPVASREELDRMANILRDP